MMVFFLALGVIISVTMIVMSVRLVQDLHVFKFVTFARDNTETSKG
jgi:hypothetical protein